MVFEVGITFFIHLVCIFSLFAGVPKQLERVSCQGTAEGERGGGRAKRIHSGTFGCIKGCTNRSASMIEMHMLWYVCNL